LAIEINLKNLKLKKTKQKTVIMFVVVSKHKMSNDLDAKTSLKNHTN
jgi:hypothetical protein